VVPAIVGASPKQVTAALAGVAETHNVPIRIAAAPAAMAARIIVGFMAFPSRAGRADIVKDGAEEVQVYFRSRDRIVAGQNP
jgi:hypothetical protein